MGVECPTCGDAFDSKRGRNYHHTVTHGESLVRETSTCDNCGDAFEYYTGDSNGQFCSRGCLKETEIGRKEGTCDFCGETFEYKPSTEPGHYCSRVCKGRDKTGEDAPNWQGGGVGKECVVCGTTFEVKPAIEDRSKTCSRACLSDWNAEQFEGENHPRWRGGSTGLYYGRSWAHIRDRVQSETCDMPGCERTETETGRRLHVHHQIPVRLFDNPEDAHFKANLMTLCAKHHTGSNGLENRSSEPVRPPMEEV